MKKLLSLILAIVLLLPAASFADTQSELVGTWVGCSEFYYGKTTYYLVRLYDDHTAMYEVNGIEMIEHFDDSHVYAGTWELRDDGLHLEYYPYLHKKEKKEIVLELTTAHYLAFKLAASYVMFVKLPDRKPVGSFHTVKNWDD